MSLYGDDCYFYYYSTCNKGTVCPYRHAPEARGNETTCTLWKAGQCVRPACRFRHMEITVDRSNIPCYWETQPTGCSKPHCPFKHFTEKNIFKSETPTVDNVQHERSVVAPINKIVTRTLDRSTPSPTALQQQNRSSPKIEPVVVNPFSDDSDEGSPLKRQQVKEINVNRAKVITFKKDEDDSSSKTDVKIKTLAEIKHEKEMLKIINDSLEKPLEEDEPYKVIERTVDATRRIVVENPTEQTTQSLVKKQIQDVQKTVLNNQPVHPVKGNVKSRLGKKFSTNKETTSEQPEKPEKPSLSSRLGLLHKTKENKAEEKPVDEIKIKSLDEIRAAKHKKIVLKKADEQTKDASPKKVIRRITVVETEDSKSSMKSAELKRKPALESQADNKKEAVVTVKKSPEERKRKIKTTKQERAIYVPPGQKTEKKISPVKISSSSPKKSRLSTESEESEEPKSQGKIHVKTFAELMAEKRKRKEAEEAAKESEEKLKTSPKKSRQFTPIVFDLDQKDKMAAPKVVAATLPFRHKKSALVTPVQNNQIKKEMSENSDISSTLDKTTSISDSKNDADVVDSSVTSSQESVEKSVPLILESDTVATSEEPGTVISSESVTVENSTPCISESETIKRIEISTVSTESNISDSLNSETVSSAQSESITSFKSVDKALDSPVVKKSTINEKKTPAPVKRKSSSMESIEKKKLRTSILSEDDILLDDDDDNNFTLSSEKYDDDDDILGDIDALLA